MSQRFSSSFSERLLKFKCLHLNFYQDKGKYCYIDYVSADFITIPHEVQRFSANRFRAKNISAGRNVDEYAINTETKHLIDRNHRQENSLFVLM